MAELTHEFSQFPDQLIEVRTMKDIDDTVSPIINQYMTAVNAGKYDEAAKVLLDNMIDIKDYFVDADFINALIEHIRNTQIVALQKAQTVFTTETADNAILGDVWIGGV